MGNSKNNTDSASSDIGISQFVELLYNYMPTVKDFFKSNFLSIHKLLEKTKEDIQMRTGKKQKGTTTAL